MRESTSNDLEAFGHIDTTCETVQEFVEDIVRDNGHYQFIFQKNTKVFGVDLNECCETIGSCDVKYVHQFQQLLRLCGYEMDVIV